jgi:hypothetical protein
MKKLATLVLGFLLTGITANASSTNSEVSNNHIYNRYDGNAYIFEEGGVEFSVFTDGQFDFAYMGPYNSGQVQVNVNTPNVNISFNAGHDYEMYVQYDNYGAVTQIENVPIYYDNYGRITRAGNVDIQYNDRRIVRVGGLYVNYNHYGNFVGCTGFINSYNQFYVYRPWHVFYAPPIFSSCIVYDYPYRRYYSPIRYSYAHHRNYYSNRHRVAYHNGRRDFYRPGSRNHYKNGRTLRNKDFNPNRRNTMIAESGRRGNTVSKGRPGSSSQAVERSRPSSMTKGRPGSSSQAVERSRPSSMTKGRPGANGQAVERSRPSSIAKGRPAKSRPAVERSRPSSMSKGRPATNKSNASKRVSSNAQRSQSRAVNSISNTPKVHKASNNTRSTSSKRGRGL